MMSLRRAASRPGLQRLAPVLEESGDGNEEEDGGASADDDDDTSSSDGFDCDALQVIAHRRDFTLFLLSCVWCDDRAAHFQLLRIFSSFLRTYERRTALEVLPS
ncbi:hypothetical protein Aduo_007578 [Ancylostoma duodenale]